MASLFHEIRAPQSPPTLFGGGKPFNHANSLVLFPMVIGAPKRLAILSDGENLFNDAISIVIFQMVIGAAGIATGMNGIVVNSFRGAVGTFSVNFFGGLAAGWVMGHLIGKVIEIIRDDD